ncbi:MAG: hypothetical protein DRP29_07400 [Thermodesulfobacteriota bacterium]|nr:MAG: hypothetical protein DRP29_07400 [Thermodesulfobacteriota bacterium]
MEKTAKKIIAIRGNHLLNKEKLKAHLAALLRLENIGVFLGNGASTVAGSKLFREIWENFVQNYPEEHNWLKKQNFLPELKYSEKDVNVEDLLDNIEIALKEWQRAGNQELNKLKKVRHCLYKEIIKAAILKEEWWENPEKILEGPHELSYHRILLQRLVASRQPGQTPPWIFTTNYDLAIEWAAESINLKVINGFEGLHCRSFSPHSFDLGYRNMLAKGEAKFGIYNIYLVKSHGSLTWQESKEYDTYFELSAQTAWEKIKFFLNSEDSDISLPIIFPFAAKYMQTIGFVLGELFRRFTEFLSRPQTCLIICGFSFSDKHLNQLFFRALQNPTLHLVICDPFAEIDEGHFNSLNKWIYKLANINSHQITIIGDKNNAYFESLVTYLPEPALYDEKLEEIKKFLKVLSHER